MKQKSLFSEKEVYKSKLNWLFVLTGAIASNPEAFSQINNITDGYFITIISAIGIVLRTFFTDTKLTLK